VFCCFRDYHYYYYYYYYIINTSRRAVIAPHNANDYCTGTVTIQYGVRTRIVLPGHVAVDFNVRFNRERMHRITSLNVYNFNSGMRFELPGPVGCKNKNKIETIKILA